MVYKGFDFNIVQGTQPGVWKWAVLTGESQGKTGESKTKPNAVVAAWRAIDQALERKKRPYAVGR